MTQCTTGWRLVLSVPRMYKFCMNLLGGVDARRELVETYIRPQPGMRILDLGCGPAAILDALPEGVNYVGVDLSEKYIDAARKRYSGKGTFHCLPVESMANANLTDFDLVLGLGVLHHLNDSQAESFFEFAASALTSGGRCLTVDPCLSPGQHPVARFLIRLDRGRNVRSADQYAVLAKAVFPSVRQSVRHDRLRLPYTHHVMECSRLQTAKEKD